MRGIGPVVGLAMLAACSNEQPPMSARDDVAGGAKTATARSATTAPEARALGNTPALTGKVSGLTSKVSGLSIRTTDMGIIIDLPADALFAFDKADLTPAATEQLGKAADVIRSSPPGTIRIVGHSDSKGDDAYNLTLSKARAERVAGWLRQQVGVRQRVFEVDGKGETVPIAPNMTPDGKDDPAGRSKNRRVEIIIPNASNAP